MAYLNRTFVFVIAFNVLVAGACGEGGGEKPINLAGQWTGTWSTSGYSGTMDIDITQTGNDISGIASASIGGMPYLNKATLTATVNGKTLTGSVMDNNVGMSFTLTIDDSTATLSGDFSSSFQGIKFSGKLEMKKK